MSRKTKKNFSSFGKCDICGMSVEHCIEMSEMQSISEHAQKSLIFDMKEWRNEK